MKKQLVKHYSTAGVIIPVVNSIMCSLEISDSDAGVMRMKREMLKSLKDRYRHMESNKYYSLATLLDPRFKQRVFLRHLQQHWQNS